MKSIIIVLFLSVAPLALAYNYHSSIYDNLNGGGVVDADPDPPAINCTVAGPICSKDNNNCGKVYICVPAGGKEWTIVESDCPEKTTCNQGKCSATPTPLCGNSKPFKCKSLIGMYPDPADCRKFHFCLPEETSEPEPATTPKPEGTPETDATRKATETPTSSECPSGFSYNPLTTYCDRPLQKDQCPALPEVGVCTNAGDTKAVKSNAVLYYICSAYDDTDKGLYPYLYMCPNGKKYKGNYVCG